MLRLRASTSRGTVPPLSDTQTLLAMEDLVDSSIAERYPKIERRYVDPPLAEQVYSLHSFIPSSGAKPDGDGVYGMVKIRGCFGTLQEATERSEDLVRSHDSYHKIYIGRVGRPLPVTQLSVWSKEVNDVDIEKKGHEGHRRRREGEATGREEEGRRNSRAREEPPRECGAGGVGPVREVHLPPGEKGTGHLGLHGAPEEACGDG